MNRQEMIRRIKEGEDPLKLSIESWEERRDTGQSSGVCALCYTQMPRGLCTTCIVRKHTGKMGCRGTPYYDYLENPTRYNASRMITFLKSLREH